MREQAVQYGTDYRRAQVFGIDATGEWKMVYTPEGTFKAKALVCLQVEPWAGLHHLRAKQISLAKE